MMVALDSRNAKGSRREAQESTRGFSFFLAIWRALLRLYARKMDQSTVYRKTRWACFLCGLLMYALRIAVVQRFHIVTYALGIYLLNILIGVISPQVDPEDVLELDLPCTSNDSGNYRVNTADAGQSGGVNILNYFNTGFGSQHENTVVGEVDAEEYRPFERKLPEFKAWVAASRAVIICLVLTLFDFVDFPVFWPILLIYFVILLCITLKHQVKRMIKYRYLPFNLRKQTYGDITRNRSLFPTSRGGISSFITGGRGGKTMVNGSGFGSYSGMMKKGGSFSSHAITSGASCRSSAFAYSNIINPPITNNSFPLPISAISSTSALSISSTSTGYQKPTAYYNSPDYSCNSSVSMCTYHSGFSGSNGIFSQTAISGSGSTLNICPVPDISPAKL